MTRKAVYFISIVLLGLIVNACQFEIGGAPNEAPPKPKNVPEKAIWSGGPDGGVFLNISQDKGDPMGVYHGQIYHDKTGDVEYSGVLKLNDSSRPIANLMEPKTYAGWDGVRLYLADGRYLTAMHTSERDSD